MTGRLAVGSLNLKLSRFTLNYCHLKGALELCFSAISSFSYAVYSMPADGWYPLVLVLTLSIKLNGCFVFLIFHFPTASWNTIVCHAVVQWMLQTPWANMTSKKRSPRLPLSRDSFPPPYWSSPCAHVAVFCRCPLSREYLWTNQLKTNPTKQGLLFGHFSSPFQLPTQLPLLSSVEEAWEEKERMFHICRGDLQSSYEYSLKIHFVSLPRQGLLCPPWKQTAQGLPHLFLEVTERIQIHFSERWIRIFIHQWTSYYTIGLHLLPLLPPNHTSSVTYPWSYAVFFLFQRSPHVNSQAYTVVIHSYCMTL